MTQLHDRALLLHGAKRNQVLTLAEVEQYGRDSFADADYVRIYGMPPKEWYGLGIRLLGRTAVECTRDALADLIGRDVVRRRPLSAPYVVIDPFAGSCNTLYWILKHVPNSVGIAFELDPQAFELSKRNIAQLDCRIDLTQGDYETLLADRQVARDASIIVFVAPPWGTALDEAAGLDLTATQPPIAHIIDWFGRKFADHAILYAIQVYERISPGSLAKVQGLLDWSELCIYDINVLGRNHGILLGARASQS
jgi:RNA cap guanine-N2 methyltransferase